MIPRPCRPPLLPRTCVRAILCFLLLALTTRGQAAQSVSLVWDASPGPDVVGYRLRYGVSGGSDTNTLDIQGVTTATITNLVGGYTYRFAVTAYNAAGLESLPSNETTFTSAPDPLPTVDLTSPGDGTVVNGPAQISLRATASKPNGSIAKVEFYAGTTRVGVATGTPFAAEWRDVPPGSYQVSAVAYDEGGVSVRSAPASLRVAALAIQALQRLPDGTSRLTITGAAGRTTRILVSDDLHTWAPLTTVVNTTGTVVVDDPGAANASRRFYRLVIE